MLSIIIPVLNEAKSIVPLLAHLEANSTAGNLSEIMVIDGGSSDETRQLVENFQKSSTSRIQLFLSEKGRARQMNIGAKKTSGDILYFLHADSFPPRDFDTLIISEVKVGNAAGCFKMKFNNRHWWLRLASWLTHFGWRACRGGDQSQFITRELFNEIGGFDETYIIYEDNVLINELYKRKNFVVIQEWLHTSARRYEQKGIWKLQYHFWTIYVKKWLGASPDQLYQYYKKNIAT